MSKKNVSGRFALVFITAGVLFVILPAVLFANVQSGSERQTQSFQGETVPTRTPVLTDTGWLPIVLNEWQVPATPTPMATPSPTPTATIEMSCLPNPPLNANSVAVEAELANTVNSYRASNGLIAYKINDRLVQAARRHANDMVMLTQAQLNSNPHAGTDGTVASQRITDACYEGIMGTEIVGWGFTSVDAMMEGFWKTSAIHNGLLLNVERDEFGPTYVNTSGGLYNHYWAVTFGSSNTIGRGPEYRCTYVFEEEGRGMSVSVGQATPCD